MITVDPRIVGRCPEATRGLLTGSMVLDPVSGQAALSHSFPATLAARFRYAVGIAVLGSGVSQWDDASGNGRHLLQATDTNRPALQADGSILFDGVDNYLQTAGFTFNQPETVYILAKSVTSTVGERVFDGAGADSGLVTQSTSPDLLSYAGAFLGPVSLAIGVYGVICTVFNGVNSVFRVNATSVSGDNGASNMSGFTLGSSGGAAAFSNIQAKEAILYSGAHNTRTQQRFLGFAFL